MDKFLTAKQLAEKYGVIKRVALGWIERGYFNNAVKADSGCGVKFWQIPESDLKDFQPPVRRGRPHDPNAPKSAIVRRGKRSKTS